MKQQTTFTPNPIFEWPTISLHDFTDVEIEFRPAKIFYTTFFSLFEIPGKIIDSFKNVFLSDHTVDPHHTEIGEKIEKELITLFDKAYSLEED